MEGGQCAVLLSLCASFFCYYHYSYHIFGPCPFMDPYSSINFDERMPYCFFLVDSMPFICRNMGDGRFCAVWFRDKSLMKGVAFRASQKGRVGDMSALSIGIV